MYLVHKQLQDECGDAAVDPDEEINGGEEDVGRARDSEQERGGVHERSDGPPAGKQGHVHRVYSGHIFYIYLIKPRKFFCDVLFSDLGRVPV